MAEAIFQHFGLSLAHVKYDALASSVLWAFIFARLRYKVVLQPIPKTREERAVYWKEFYNSSLGKGTPEHYLSMASMLDILDLGEYV